MSNAIIPLLGSKGTYVAKAPFDVLVGAVSEYTCIATRTLSDYIVNNEDPLTQIYAKASQDTVAYTTMYEKALVDNVVILTLQSDEGFVVYLPCDYLVSYPNLNGIPYVKKGIAVQLPLMPDNVDYTPFVDGLTDYIKGALGVADVSVLLANISVPVALTYDVDQATRAARRVAMADKGSLMVQLERLRREFDIVVAQRDALQSLLNP